MIEALNICKSFKNGTVRVLKDVSVNRPRKLCYNSRCVGFG